MQNKAKADTILQNQSKPINYFVQTFADSLQLAELKRQTTEARLCV